MLASSQIATRSTGIGASEVAAICGLSFWGDGAHKVWLRKMGLVEASEASVASQLGDEFERVLEPIYERHAGTKIVPLLDISGDPSTMRHPEHPWALASIDRVRVSDWIPVEVKFTCGDRAHYFQGREEFCSWCKRRENLHWGFDVESIPDDVRCQVQWQLFVTGAPWAHVARLWLARGGPELKIYTIQRSEEDIRFLFGKASKFWHDHVLTKVAPDPDESEDSELCERLSAPKVLQGIIDAPIGTVELVNEYLDGARLIREGTEKKEGAANWLRRYCGSAEGLRGMGYMVTNKARKDGVRVLSVRKK